MINNFNLGWRVQADVPKAGLSHVVLDWDKYFRPVIAKLGGTQTQTNMMYS